MIINQMIITFSNAEKTTDNIPNNHGQFGFPLPILLIIHSICTLLYTYIF